MESGLFMLIVLLLKFAVQLFMLTSMGDSPIRGPLLYLDTYPFQKATAQFSTVFDGRLFRLVRI